MPSGRFAVFFDLDGTLYDRDALLRDLATEQWQLFSAELANAGRAWYIERLVALDDHGYQDKHRLYRQLVAECGLDAELVDPLVQHFWEAYDRHCRLPADTAHTLATLRREGMRLGVITNGSTARQQAKLRALGLDGCFDAVLISEAEGVRKPEREIFRRALARCGVEASDTIFVGDHPEADVRGARAAGLAAIWKRVPYWRMDLADVPSVDRLSEILPYCIPGLVDAGAP